MRTMVHILQVVSPKASKVLGRAEEMAKKDEALR
jgi:hypothetical protein